ncbi:LysR family transcriptional regulator [Psychrobacillus glaciei]|uniref:LysR family transcriptional regulator n=1 Tax=Psychrobacillus glaciei TaxID=2283160 RepID=A0A5J6SKL7_9BACI|nr:LysR family transcriptional regulator [Psychrobacillus glaciei]QFF98461.1 LysR family transcriptional regulator [Psychrobacillus glaciei]
MNLEQMEYIKEIIHTQSISIAAQNLHVSQSAISQSISLLEKELGIRLFKRSRFGTKPTEEGKGIINNALKIVDNIERIKEEAQAFTTAFKGELKIAAIPGFMTFLPKILSLFKKDFPHIKIMVIEMESKRIIEKVKQHTIDLGFISVKKSIEDNLPDHFIFKKLDYNADIKVIVSKNSPLAFQKDLTLHDLADNPIVIYSSQFWEDYIHSFEKSHNLMNVLFQTSNSEVIKKTVSEGLAIGLLSSYVLIDDPYIETGRIIPIPLIDTKFSSDNLFGCIVSDKNVHQGIAKKFMEYIHPNFN